MAIESVYPDYQPKPGARRYGTAIVGAGDIVRSAHLPAYRKAGFPVTGLYDIDRERAEEAAERFGVARVYDSLEQLLADPEAHIVDIAVPASAQKRIAEAAIRSGKHLLCQKPLAPAYADAADIVEQAERAGLRLAVNQQMRWAPLIASCRDLIRRGWIGEPYFASICESIHTPMETWPWLLDNGQFDLMYHSIHYLDAIRHLLGMPSLVYASLSGLPGDRLRPETRSLVLLEYEDERRALISTNHRNRSDDVFAELRIEGAEGVIKGTIGLSYNYPHGRPDTIEYESRRYYPNQWFRHTYRDLWIPDAFVGSMGELHAALDEGREPTHSGRDNLLTLQLVNAAYWSMRDKRGVCPREVDAARPAGEIPYIRPRANPHAEERG